MALNFLAYLMPNRSAPNPPIESPEINNSDVLQKGENQMVTFNQDGNSIQFKASSIFDYKTLLLKSPNDIIKNHQIIFRFFI